MYNKYIVEERLNRRTHPLEPARWLHIYDDLKIAKDWIDGSILDMKIFGFICKEETIIRPLWAFNVELVHLYTLYNPTVSNGNDSKWERKYVLYVLDKL